MKGTAHPGLAVHRQLAAHHLHQALANGQAQPGAAKAPGGGGFGLGKALKNMLLVFRGNANAAVAHREAQRGALGRLRQHLDLHQHFALRGELDGIARQVDQHLLQAHGIAHQHPGGGGVDVKQHLHRLLVDIGGHDDGQVPHQAVDAEGLHLQLHLAGVNLGEIQNVVEQAEQ